MPEKKARPWLRILLGVSLTLNLLVAGVVAGGVLSRNQGPEGRGAARDSGLFALVVLLPKEDRRDLRRALDKSASDGNASRPVPGQYQARILDVLRSDPFDAAAFEAALSERRLARNLWAEGAESALAAQVAGLNTAQREDYANRLERWSRNRHRRDKERHDRQ